LTAAGRREHALELDEQVGAKFRERTQSDLFHTGQEWGMTFTALQTAADVVHSDQLVARQFLVHQDHPEAGRVTMPGPVAPSAREGRSAPRPAPRLGEHNAAVFGELGVSSDQLDILIETGVV